MDTLKSILPYSQSIIAVLLIIAIIFQSSGVGLSSTFGGTDMPEMTKRGPEKFLYFSSMVLAILLIVHSIAFVLLK